jgi:hypothetical protein
MESEPLRGEGVCAWFGAGEPNGGNIRMNDARPAKRPWSLFGLAITAALIPACHSDGQRANQTRVAYKPIQTSLRGRAFYVSGYGGADYSPSRPRRGVPGGVDAAYAPAAEPTADAPAVSIRQGTWDEP